MSKATLKVSIEGQTLVCLDVLMMMNLIGYNAGHVPGELINVDYENCDYELEVITRNGAEEVVKRVFELDVPVYEDD